jgi:hypothetical protein
MPEDLGKQIGHLWDRFRKKASDTMARPGVALIRGKTAARDVFDDAGNLLIGAGHIIDDDTVELASTTGKLAALVAAAAGAQTQDITERLKGAYDRTPEGQDRRNLADSEQYIEARRYIRYIAAVEITDIRGNVLIPAGKVIEDEDVRRMREEGQLAALIYSAQQSSPPPHQDTADKAPPTLNLPPRRRHATPLSEGPDEDPRS